MDSYSYRFNPKERKQFLNSLAISPLQKRRSFLQSLLVAVYTKKALELVAEDATKAEQNALHADYVLSYRTISVSAYTGSLQDYYAIYDWLATKTYQGNRIAQLIRDYDGQPIDIVTMDKK